jgi:hypothetical protein
MFKLLLTFSLVFASGPVTALAAPLKIILPPASASSEVQGFAPEWCTSAVHASSGAAAGNVTKLCYGHISFETELSVRAFLVYSQNRVITGAGSLTEPPALLYIEKDRAPVELRQLNFEIIGPVRAGFQHVSEIGQATLQIDARGEVQQLTLSSPSLGEIQAARP